MIIDVDKIEKGVASMLIALDEGNITVKHGEDGYLLAHLDNAPDGTWDKLWDCFEELGFIRDCGKWRHDR